VNASGTVCWGWEVGLAVVGREGTTGGDFVVRLKGAQCGAAQFT
jgi:hypothetical protein